MRSSRLFSDRGALIQALLGVCCVAGIFALTSGVFITVVTLEHSLLLGAYLGVALLLGGVFLMELDRWHEEKNGNHVEQGSTDGQDRGPKTTDVVAPAAIMQALIVMLFGLLLDGHVRMTACLYSCRLLGGSAPGDREATTRPHLGRSPLLALGLAADPRHQHCAVPPRVEEQRADLRQGFFVL